MRLFTAIELPSDVLARLERLIASLRPEALVKWSPLDNLHITVKFIGEWPEARLEELDGKLATLVPREPFDLEIRELCWFPNERAPRVLCAGVDGGRGLIELAKDTEEVLAPLGIAKEERAFSPHLTLARMKNPVPLGRLRQRIREIQPVAFGSFRPAHFSLFRSEPGSNASIYRRLCAYRFQTARAAS